MNKVYIKFIAVIIKDTGQVYRGQTASALFTPSGLCLRVHIFNFWQILFDADVTILLDLDYKIFLGANYTPKLLFLDKSQSNCAFKRFD